MSKRTVIYMECDNPHCSTERQHSTEEPALGYHMKAVEYHHGYGGGRLKEVYACSTGCIAPAIEDLIEKQRA